ncbi:ParB/RepB/Spo0J family partition protein [Streptomyces axinellae]|uniref:ParB/RepB/Spo0J family partition protein n=1 Tax=Streptomyces axinellae TaxID=552788 RepID=A0ABN3R0K4_9ACTN
MSKADQLRASTSFTQARPVSARRAAISAATDVPTEGVPDPTQLPLALISQNPDNPREELRNLEDLTQSIKELGVVNAITIASVSAYLAERPEQEAQLDEGAKYLVVDGHRRLEASRRAGETEIRVVVDDRRVTTDKALLEAAFVANFHNDQMTDLEQAHALEKLVAFYGSQTKASERLGISQATISSKLSLLKLSPELQADLATGTRHIEHVRNLGKLSPDEQRAAADDRAARAKQRSPRTTGTKKKESGGNYHAVISEKKETSANGRHVPPQPAPSESAQPDQQQEAPAPAHDPAGEAVQALADATENRPGDMADALAQHLPKQFLTELLEALQEWDK